MEKFLRQFDLRKAVSFPRRLRRKGCPNRIAVRPDGGSSRCQGALVTCTGSTADYN